MITTHGINELWTKKQQSQLGKKYFKMIQDQKITIGDKTMSFYKKPMGLQLGDSTLIIGLHPGSSKNVTVEQAYKSFLDTYKSFLPNDASGTIWIAPRSIDQEEDIWCKPYISEFLGTMIKAFVLKGDVDANKIYLTGSKEGGDAVYQLSPMHADWWAGANTASGHPNGVAIQNLINTPFSIQASKQQDENGFQASEYIQKMKALKNKYGNFQTKHCTIHPKKYFGEHQELKNLIKLKRKPYPEKILFKQHPMHPQKYLYYIQVEPEKHKQLIIVYKRGNDFHIESQKIPITVYINNYLVDYEGNVRVFHNGVQTAEKKPQRNMQIVEKSIDERVDPSFIFQDCLVSVPTCDRVALAPFSEIPLSPTIQRANVGGEACCSVM